MNSRNIVESKSNRSCIHRLKRIFVAVAELFYEKISAAFASRSLLEIGGDECDNLNFVHLKNEKSWILGNYKIRKIRLLDLCVVCARVIQTTQCPTTSAASSVPRTKITTTGPSALAPRSTTPAGGTRSALSATLTASTSRSHIFELTQNQDSRNFIRWMLFSIPGKGNKVGCAILQLECRRGSHNPT